MVEERKIEAALELEVAGLAPDPQLWEQIRGSVAAEAARPGPRQRWRLGSVLQVTAACAVLAFLLLNAAVREGAPTPGGGKGPPSTPMQVAPSMAHLADLRRQVAYPVFLPSRAPAGLVPQVPQGPAEAGRPVHIAYKAPDGTEGLRVTVGPAGCCLDTDMPRKRGEVIPIRGGIEGHFLINQPEFGGNILWWTEAGAYVALSGPTLTRADLVAISGSMSAAYPQPEGIPRLEQVRRARVNLGLPVPDGELPRPLRAEVPADHAMIAKLLGWLGGAEVVEGEIAPPGRAPTLVFEVEDGTIASVQAAYDCTTTRRADATEVSCRWAEGQVVFHARDRAPVRVYAPELAAWLNEGWERDLGDR